jgi:DNA-binding MarR family transcriptional regulator
MSVRSASKVTKGRPALRFDPIAEARRQWSAHGWGRSADSMALVTSVMRAEQIFKARADVILRPFGLTFARYEVLMLLLFSRRGALPLGKVGERLQVGAASVTNAIDRLEADGLVRRRDNPDDGRGVLSAITPAGKRLALRATADLNEELFDRLELSRPETKELFDLLGELRRRAGDFG